MSKLIWDNVGERLYETGVSKAVVYPRVDGAKTVGVAWNGITAITESPSGAEATALYADDIKYLNLLSAEEFGGTIEAYAYPEEFKVCDGTADLDGIAGISIGQQPRRTFDLCYVTKVGNDVEGNDHGYKIHLIYNCLAAPSERGYSTINDSPEAITFSWEFKTTPINVEGYKPTACITIDTTKLTKDYQKEQVQLLEDILYGVDGEEFSEEYASLGYVGEPSMVYPDTLIEIFGSKG